MTSIVAERLCDYDPEMGEPTDLATLLYQGGGAFNHSVWQTRPTQGPLNPLDQLLTLHESSHFELNNVSSTGMVLTFLAELARHGDGDRVRYRQLLNGFVQRSRLAHEVYATWYSVEHLSIVYSKVLLIRSLSSEYANYYTIGENVLHGVKSPFLRQQVFLTLVRSCFEARSLGEFEPARVDLFQLGEIRARDYPDERLKFILKNSPVAELISAAEEFCRTCNDREIARLIEHALTVDANHDFFEGYSAEADRATLLFLEWLHNHLARVLERQSRPLNPFGHHLTSVVHRIVAVSNERCKLDPRYRPLKAANSPHDAVSMLLRNMENEVYRVKEHSVPVIAFPFSSVVDEQWGRLAEGEPARLVIHARTSRTVRLQHHNEASDFSAIDGQDPLVFIRRRIQGGTANLVVFSSPAALKQFRGATKSTPAYGVVSSLVCSDGAWLSEWVDDSIVWLTLIEHSLHSFLVGTCANADKIIYEVSTIRDGSQALVFLSFLTTTSEPGGSLYLAICGELAAKSCLQFIALGLRDPRFVRDGQIFKTDLEDMLRTVVTALWRDESFFNSNQLSFA